MNDSSLDEIVVEATAIHLTMGDMAKNYHTIRDKIFDSAKNGVHLITFPETAIAGYVVGDEVEMDRFIINNKRVLNQLINDTKELDIAVAIGHIDYKEGRIGHDGRTLRYNSATVFQKGKVLGTQHKNLLPTYTLFDDARHYEPGTELNVIEMDLHGRKVKLGVGICEMKWSEDYMKMVDEGFTEFKNTFLQLSHQSETEYIQSAKVAFDYERKMDYANPAMAFKKQGAELLVWLNASPFHAGKILKIDSINRARVQETGLPLVDCNFVGIGDNVYDLFGFSGESGVMGSDGNYIAVTRPWKTESAVAKINLSTGLGSLVEGQEARTFKKNLSYPEFKREYIDQIIDATIFIGGEFVRQSGFNTVIESVSGGIDSAVGTCFAALMKEQGFFENLGVYSFPTQYNTGTTKGVAQHVCDALGLNLVWWNIQNRFEFLLTDYLSHVKPAEYNELVSRVRTESLAAGEERKPNVDEMTLLLNDSVTAENMQARVRSEIMKEISNDTRALEFVNPNKDERRQGYTTLWGDMAGSLMIIGDYDKWVVKAVAERMNERYGNGLEIIPSHIIHTVNPSAELSAKQNPEKGGGDPFNYLALGMILDNYTFGRLDVPDIVESFNAKKLNHHYAPELFPDGKSIYEKFTSTEFESLVTQYLRRNEIMRFKGVVAPLAIKVTRRALGFELRTPVLSQYFRSAPQRKELGFY